MNNTPFSNDNDGFDILDLQARFVFKTDTSISFDIGRWSNTLRIPRAVGGGERGLVQDTPFVFNVIGWIDVHHPCDGHIRTYLRIRMPEEYHALERVKSIVATIFKALDIPLDETYEATAFDSDNVIAVVQPKDRNGMTEQSF